MGETEKFCYGCVRWLSKTKAFTKDRSRYDGRSPICRKCRGSLHRRAYIPARRPASGRSFVPARDGDKKQARRRVNYFVEAELIPAPNDLPCAECGHKMEEGGSPARHEYHHHKGYAAECHEDVIVLCTFCHKE